MNRSRSGPFPSLRRAPSANGQIRLDLLGNPYGPSVHVQDALASCDDLHQPAGEREIRLHLRLANLVGVPPGWLTLANGIDELLQMVLLWRRESGPLVLFPPADPQEEHRARLHRLDILRLPRRDRFALPLDPATVASVPASATALVASPHDPSGTLLGSQDAVRLARTCELVVVDERHTEYSARTLIPFVREFENLLVLQTFETWAGLAGLPIAFAVARPEISADLARYRRPGGVALGAVLAAQATLDDLAYVRATVQRVREEKSRLYRTLRKLNMVSVPYPSWANFLLARVERGGAALFARELGRHNIRVHVPSHPDLGTDHLRISASSPDATLALKRALIEIAAPL